MLKTFLLSAAFVGASVIGAAAQSTTPSSSGTPNVSPATHCKDKATGHVRMKGAADKGSATSANSTGAAAGASIRPGGNTSTGISGQDDTRSLGNDNSMSMSGQEDTRSLGSSGSINMSGQEDTRHVLQDCQKG
jgi:hypothetical protein